MPGAHRLRPVQPVHHRVQILPGRVGTPPGHWGGPQDGPGRGPGRHSRRKQEKMTSRTPGSDRSASQPVDLPGAPSHHGTNAPITPKPGAASHAHASTRSCLPRHRSLQKEPHPNSLTTLSASGPFNEIAVTLSQQSSNVRIEQYRNVLFY